jgi:hypothetical protein
MDALKTAYMARLTALHQAMDETIAGLLPEALAWSPGPEMNSIAVLAVHVAGAERYLIGELVGGEPSGRNRAAEFETRGGEAAELRARLATTLVHARSVLERLSVEELERLVYSPQHEQTFSVAYALLRALDHTAEHVGHMQMARQLWEQRRAAEG